MEKLDTKAPGDTTSDLPQPNTPSSPLPPPPESTLRQRWKAVTKVLLIPYKIPGPPPPPPRTPQRQILLKILIAPVFWFNISLIFCGLRLLLPMDFDKDTVSLMKLHGRILLQGITGGTVLDLVLLGWYLTGGSQI
ncbi:hypothetical protein QC764_0080260 [Podospora pseudoanserina]|uniref:Uncharacterized protein n=1 Tax=Podospora pseudoanserina TaxID=2609844 RepID=A0ABR0I5N3_9PEZI|nr:hypothetical protein QC764_0080260 [Podospora pseudoanserina]